ncbi:uncharacterized mitochondrial protein AtMg00810-like [Lycium barbarum]|uniref:uncharacterized mitochondrial protein AtMg00810-like n=1 Tax=Lycium barbarum TaxID=112863 RepID=UPI00293E088F|nr:uncharacterized mitochondrial protein AtMg00810-like [Lycium barbarum]
MHQRKYALELISVSGLGAAKSFHTPIDISVKLTTREYDQHLKETIDQQDKQASKKTACEEDEVLQDQSAHQRIIGKLLYLTVTRPNISYSVQNLSEFLQQPKRSYMEAHLRIIRYIKSHPGKGILLSSNRQDTITAYYDADWAACLFSRKSITGFLIKLGDSLVSWKSKKQSIISRSS